MKSERPYGAPASWPAESVYLGDGAYAAFDGCYVLVGAAREDGWDWVALESWAVCRLVAFATRVLGPLPKEAP